MRTTLRYQTFCLASLALLLSLAGGCLNLSPEPDPTRFYVLTPGEEQAAETIDPEPRTFAILGPITIAPYLQQNAIAIRRGDHRIQYSGLHQWAEPLDDGIGRRLIWGVNRNLENVHVAAYGSLSPGSDTRQLIVELLQFDLIDDSTAVVQCRWKLVQASRNGSVLASGYQTIRTAFDPMEGSLEPGVAALRESLDELSGYLATRLANHL